MTTIIFHGLDDNAADKVFGSIRWDGKQAVPNNRNVPFLNKMAQEITRNPRVIPELPKKYSSAYFRAEVVNG